MRGMCAVCAAHGDMAAADVDVDAPFSCTIRREEVVRYVRKERGRERDSDNEHREEGRRGEREKKREAELSDLVLSSSSRAS